VATATTSLYPAQPFSSDYTHALSIYTYTQCCILYLLKCRSDHILIITLCLLKHEYRHIFIYIFHERMPSK
jgi:hypothetical protein